MMQQLKSMGVLIHPNLNQLDIAEKVDFGGAITKSSCSTLEHNIDTTTPQPDNMLILSRMVETMEDTFVITLKHEPSQYYIIGKSYILDILHDSNWLDITTLQLWCT